MPVIELSSEILIKVDSGHLKDLSHKELRAVYRKLHKEYSESVVEDEDDEDEADDLDESEE